MTPSSHKIPIDFKMLTFIKGMLRCVFRIFSGGEVRFYKYDYICLPPSPPPLERVYLYCINYSSGDERKKFNFLQGCIKFPLT